MQIDRYTDPSLFLSDIEPYLLLHEAENNLMFGLTNELIDNRQRYGDEEPILLAVTEDDSVVAAALQTPPHNLVLSYPSDSSALNALVEELDRAAINLPGVTGPSAEAEEFALLWNTITGTKRTKKMAQRIYKLTRVKKPQGVPGALRPADRSELDLIVSWFKGFNRDAFADPRQGDEETIRKFTESIFSNEDRKVYLWEDGEPASMALHTGPTPNGLRIGAVYTPPENRKRGYASACVAALSQVILDSERNFCFLYTDLANPTSNHIYMEIGYEPVCDSDMWSFSSE